MSILSEWEGIGSRWMIAIIKKSAFAESITRLHTQEAWMRLRKCTTCTELNLMSASAAEIIYHTAKYLPLLRGEKGVTE